MALIDEIKKNCPYCGLEGTIKQFIGWDENGKRGYQGQASDGMLIILCPKCQKKIRYDIQVNMFLTFSSEEPLSVSGGNGLFSWISGLVCLSGSVYFILNQKIWWGYLAGAVLFVYGWMSIKTALRGTRKKTGIKKIRQTFFGKTEQKAKQKL